MSLCPISFALIANASFKVLLKEPESFIDFTVRPLFMKTLFLAFPVLAIFLSLNSQVALSSNPKDQLSLVMIEEHGCPYCRAWIRDVGSFYHKTPEGKFAPLVRVNRAGAKSRFRLRVSFTPTFVVLKGGKEVGRLTGYIDDSFFWPQLDAILGRNGFKETENPS